MDERGDEVLSLALSSSMVYSRAASTFHSLETGPRVGVALYFGSESDEWFDPFSPQFAAALEAEISRLQQTRPSPPSPLPAPAVPSRPAPRPAAPKSPAPVKRAPPAKSSSSAPAPLSPKEPVHEEAEYDYQYVEELVEGGKKPTHFETMFVRTNMLVKVPSSTDLSQDVDYSTMEVLPPLPAEIPSMSSQREYKNYQKLKFEILRRNPEAVIVSATPAPASSPRRNTNAARPSKTVPIKKSTPHKAEIVTAAQEIVSSPLREQQQQQHDKQQEDKEQKNQQQQEQQQQYGSPQKEEEIDVEAPSPPAPTVVQKQPQKQEHHHHHHHGGGGGPPEIPPLVFPSSSAPPLVKEVVGKIKLQLQSVVEYPDGSRYLGELVAGVKHGKGFVVYCDGSTFEGSFLNGKRYGIGTRTSALTKEVFRGSYFNDQKHGPGWLFCEDGSELFCFYNCNERHGCASFRWPRGVVVDQQYENGKLLVTQKVSDATWPPAHLASSYEPAQGYSERIEWSGTEATFVSVLGSWDGFTKLIPLGHDMEAGIHSIGVVLRKGRHLFRFVVNGAECVSHHNVWPVEHDENGIASHVLVAM